MIIDPHTHSTCSDGTDTPTHLMHAAAQAGIDVLGLTDHDTTRGWQEAEQAVAETGVTLLRGAELSCAWEGITMHLLAYLFDPTHEGLREAMERSRTDRQTRARRMVDLLSEDFPITWEDVVAQVGENATVGRPHLADALVQAGCFPDRTAAFAGPLATGSPYYVRHWALDPVDAVRMVREAGGVPVIAHPRANKRQKRLVPDEVIAQMAEAGLVGLEVHHRDHDDAAREQARQLASSLGLLMSGSSDYHGTGKPNRLGENRMEPEVLEAIVAHGSLPLVRP